MILRQYGLVGELIEAKKAAVEAGNAIMAIYEKEFEIEYKSDNSPVTEADKEANEIIVKRLKDVFPRYAVLAEESKEDRRRLGSEWCWVIDPLDGTKEFIKKNDEFTVNIALTHFGKSVMGIIYLPVTKEFYYAVKGRGTYFENLGACNRIFVSKKTEDITALKSKSHGSDQLDEILKNNNVSNFKSVGSSIKGCAIAKGEAEIYYRFGYTSEWDTAAMQIIVEEAGGIFRQMDDSEMTYNRVNTLNDKGFYILNTIENKLDIGE